MAQALPNNRVGWTLSDQMIRSGTSVAANYRAICRATSDKDSISKLETVLEEADETLFWMELIQELELIDTSDKMMMLMKEAEELVAIFASGVKTVKNRLNQKNK